MDLSWHALNSVL